MSLTYRIVDAFAAAPFTGNPAAVCLVDRFPPDTLMQRIALEMNLSETAFVTPSDSAVFDLRWFTPLAEVDLCGHATLAAAHVLYRTRAVEEDEAVRFRTRSGVLGVERTADGRLSMDFPAEPVEPIDAPDGLSEALGVAVVACGSNRMDILAELADESTLRAVRPDMTAIADLDCRGVIVTARSDRDGRDFVSRFFAPAMGVPEDPVTGSAHCALAPYWAERLGRDRLIGWQASARGGLVEVVYRGERVDLVGSAVTVAEGRFLL